MNFSPALVSVGAALLSALASLGGYLLGRAKGQDTVDLKDWIISKGDAIVAEIVKDLLPSAAGFLPAPFSGLAKAAITLPEVQAELIKLGDKGVGDVAAWVDKEWTKLETFLKTHLSTQVQNALSTVSLDVYKDFGPTVLHMLLASKLAGTLQADVAQIQAALAKGAAAP